MLNPIMSFFVFLSDGAMTLLHKLVYHANESLINIDTSANFWSAFIVIAAAVTLSAIAIASVVITGGGTLTIVLGVIKILLVAGVTTTITFPVTTSLVEGMLPDSFYFPLYSITPQEIFSNKIPLLDVDFFNPTESKELDDGTKMESTASELRPTISNWYTILRDISLVALLSVLVYTGIRILISSTSNDKAKYKQMLVDWVVAICLLFMMQYIMSFSNLFVEKIIDLVDTTQINSEEKDTNVIEPEMYDISDEKMVKKAYEALVSDPAKKGKISSEESSPYYNYFVDSSGNAAGSNATRLLWPAENFMQQARINLQLLDDNKDTFVSIGWKLIYVVLVVFTFIFIFTYLKRVIYMAFLTLIAPLVALTYPIDKMADGKAQAFNSWFKEYVFNLLIQPMHLILYTVLVGSAMDFASENILYVIVALGFMVPAEKLLRRFFGFEKAHTPGLLGGPAGAAIMMNGMNKLFGKTPKGGKNLSGKGSGGKEVSNEKDDKIKFKDSNLLDDKPDDISDNGEQNNLRLNEANNNDETVSSTQGGKGLNNGKSQYFEDNIAEWARSATNKIANSGPVKNITDWTSSATQRVGNLANSATQKVGNLKPIRAVRALPQHSRFVNAGVNGIRRIAGAGAKGIKKSTNTMANRLGNSIKEFNPAKAAWNVTKTGVKAAVGGGTGLVAGSLAGIASGDPSKAVQYATAGAMGGYKLADGIDNKISDDLFSNTGFKEAFTKEYYGDDYDQHMINKKVNEIQSNYDNKQKVLDKFDGDKDSAKKFMNSVVPEYVQYGITDMNDIFAGEELVKSGTSRDMAIKVASTVNEYGKNTSRLGAKDSEDLNKTILNRTRKQFNAKSTQEIDKIEDKKQKEAENTKLRQAQNLANQTRELMNKYSGTKYKKMK